MPPTLRTAPAWCSQRSAAALGLLLPARPRPWGEGRQLGPLVFLWMGKAQSHFLNGPEWVRFMDKNIYNLKQLQWAQVLQYRDTYLTPTMSISLVPPSSSQPGPGRLLCSVMDFYPAHIQLRWFQGQQELFVLATDMVPNGDWTHQLLALLETPPPVWGHLQLPGGARQPGAAGADVGAAVSAQQRPAQMGGDVSWLCSLLRSNHVMNREQNSPEWDFLGCKARRGPCLL
uniref:Uncharacterized protein n=1 Tax=Geospiza parvula TaxID=87175 RepID=A0A8U8CA28_GEOPR